VVTENTKWEEGLIAVNCAGFGGVNTHMILEPGPTVETEGSENGGTFQFPLLVTLSGRTEGGVQQGLSQVLYYSESL